MTHLLAPKGLSSLSLAIVWWLPVQALAQSASDSDNIVIPAENEPAWIFDGDLAERIGYNAQALALRESPGLEPRPDLRAGITGDLTAIYAMARASRRPKHNMPGSRDA